MEQSKTDPQKQILEEARERARENHLAQENDRVHTLLFHNFQKNKLLEMTNVINFNVSVNTVMSMKPSGSIIRDIITTVVISVLLCFFSFCFLTLQSLLFPAASLWSRLIMPFSTLLEDSSELSHPITLSVPSLTNLHPEICHLS